LTLGALGTPTRLAFKDPAAEPHRRPRLGGAASVLLLGVAYLAWHLSSGDLGSARSEAHGLADRLAAASFLLTPTDSTAPPLSADLAGLVLTAPDPLQG
jgi:hypothetical protein